MSERESWHGRLTGYSTRKCRCDECREAGRAYRQAKKGRLREGSAPALTHAQRGAMSARARHGDAPKVVRMDSLPPDARRRVLALVDSLRAEVNQ